MRTELNLPSCSMSELPLANEATHTGSSSAWQQTKKLLLGERVRVTRNERGKFVTADGLVVEWLPLQLVKVAIPTVPHSSRVCFCVLSTCFYRLLGTFDHFASLILSRPDHSTRER